MAAEARLSAQSPVVSERFKTRLRTGWWVDESAIDGWVDGGREGLGASYPAWIHSSHHLYTKRGTLRAMAVFGSASVSYCQAGNI